VAPRPLAVALAERIPRGEDCGAHEWYRQSADLEHATRAGSAAAESALLEQIRNGSAHVIENTAQRDSVLPNASAPDRL
jgi:hypothetical protein